MAIIGDTYLLKCKLMARTLKEASLRWYMSLSRFCITSYLDLTRKMIHHFSVNIHKKVSTTNLFNIRQGYSYTLREYLTRFNEDTHIHKWLLQQPKLLLYAITCGSLMANSVEDANAITKRITLSDHQSQYNWGTCQRKPYGSELNTNMRCLHKISFSHKLHGKSQRNYPNFYKNSENNMNLLVSLNKFLFVSCVQVTTRLDNYLLVIRRLVTCTIQGIINTRETQTIFKKDIIFQEAKFLAKGGDRTLNHPIDNNLAIILQYYQNKHQYE